MTEGGRGHDHGGGIEVEGGEA
jgi:hypothetical protein